MDDKIELDKIAQEWYNVDFDELGCSLRKSYVSRELARRKLAKRKKK